MGKLFIFLPLMNPSCCFDKGTPKCWWCLSACPIPILKSFFLLYQTNQQKEPLILHDAPQHPWSHVATDLLTLDMKEGFIIAYYWSDYFELNQLPDSQTGTVIKSLKNQFLVTIRHSSHRKSSKNLQYLEKLLTKARASGEDPYLAIPDSCNMPYPSIGASSVHRLFGRPTKTFLPQLEHCSSPRSWKELKKSWE